MLYKKKIRLNHYIASSGVSSRRKADDLIKSGIIEVNGVTVYKIGTIINNNDIVKFNGEKIKPKKNIYLLLNKPKNIITTTKDQFNRKTVIDLIPKNFITERIFPVGRLDSSTTGVLILTNDGILSNKMTHPKYKIQKIYIVSLNKKIKDNDFNKIMNGKIYFKEGKLKVNILKKFKNNKIKIGLFIGWNRIIRRLFRKLNYKVVKLDRISFGGFTKKDIVLGGYRNIKTNEITKFL